MLQNAQYSVWFRTPAGEGHSIVSLMDGDVSGADNISYYTGTYVQEGNKFAATINVIGQIDADNSLVFWHRQASAWHNLASYSSGS